MGLMRPSIVTDKDVGLGRFRTSGGGGVLAGKSSDNLHQTFIQRCQLQLTQVLTPVLPWRYVRSFLWYQQIIISAGNRLNSPLLQSAGYLPINPIFPIFFSLSHCKHSNILMWEYFESILMVHKFFLKYHLPSMWLVWKYKFYYLC